MVRTSDGGCQCATSWCELNLTFDLVVVTMSFKILSGLLNFVRCRRWKLGKDIGWGGVGVTFSFGSAKVCSPAIFETCFSYDKDIWIAATKYYMYFHIIMLFSLTYVLLLHVLNLQCHNF